VPICYFAFARYSLSVVASLFFYLGQNTLAFSARLGVVLRKFFKVGLHLPA